MSAPAGSPTYEDYKAAQAREKADAAQALAEAVAALPPVQEIALERGAMLYLRPQLDGRWMADVRWATLGEKDPLLAAGGYRTGIADNAKKAEKLGRALHREGVRREARQ